MVKNVLTEFKQFAKSQFLKFHNFCSIQVIRLKHILTVSFIDDESFVDVAQPQLFLLPEDQLKRHSVTLRLHVGAKYRAHLKGSKRHNRNTLKYSPKTSIIEYFLKMAALSYDLKSSPEA